MAAPRSSRDQELLRRIDACIDRMRAVTPDEPYVLSIPQDEPKYHHHSHHSSQMWRSGTPFRHDDDPNQQYQTFYYHEPLSDVFQLHRNSHYQKDNVSVSSQTKERENSAQSTPSMLPKKKISLAAYANKKTHPDPKHDADHDKPPRDKPLSKPPSSQSLNSRDSANLPRMLSPLQFPQPDRPIHEHRSAPQQSHPSQRSLLPPRMISPTLPPSIIASLDANPYQPSRHKHASKRLPSPSAPPSDKPSKHPPTLPEPETRDSPQEEDRPSPNPSRIVIFKIPKSMRKNLCRYLQMKPQKTILVLPPEKPPAPVQAPPQAAKRPRAAQEEEAPLPESKRQKPVKSEPITKQEPNTPSPATPAAHKDTPIARNFSKDLRASVALKRVESTDSMVNGTPQSSRQANGITRPSPSSGTVKTAEAKAWELEASRIGLLARELKHAVPVAQKPGGSNDPEPRSRETAAATALESLLMFMLMFYCTERGHSSRNPPAILDGGRTWLTIPPFVSFVRSHCSDFPVLEGVACHLGVVCNAMVMLRVTSTRDRAQDMAPDEARILHNAASAGLKLSKDANARLPLATIISTFPRTWKKATSSAASDVVSDDSVKVGRYAGDFALPLGIDTEPLVAVRIGYAMLREWCTSKGLRYDMKVGL